MSVDVVLHYRPNQNDPNKLQNLVEKVLKKFSTRRLPEFIPWFPNDLKLPFKPKMLPPVISGDEVEDIERLSGGSELCFAPPAYDCTVGLLEFKPSLNKRLSLLRAQSVPVEGACGLLEKEPVSRKAEFRRSWSVSSPRCSVKERIVPLSQELQKILERQKLCSFHRSRWTIESSNCDQTLEDVWVKLNRMIKHHELPTCNATVQRDMNQIWVFCDVLYCEYVGNLLKERLTLTGKINLIVHKHGVIFSI
ncbi:shieldin complex subunit 3 [Microcaecilia unicolor]|uniref:Shieldin complex subunit 3 n=1 Tax=Microcaecilia unicolor TaxID=1415580 RepID=A0A6P7X0J4_9AMPH|nr:shieldin complex subunit 3 [Microcaecilia unicolor]